ncbi:hypothetical protein JYU34_005024, partial [Plutella xylostella]
FIQSGPRAAAAAAAASSLSCKFANCCEVQLVMGSSILASRPFWFSLRCDWLKDAWKMIPRQAEEWQAKRDGRRPANNM